MTSLLKFGDLNRFLSLSNVVSEDIKCLFTQNVDFDAYIKQSKNAIRIYSVFVEVSSINDGNTSCYKAKELYWDINAFQLQFREVIGFLYTCFEGSTKAKYNYAKSIERFYVNFANRLKFPLEPIEIASKSISSDVERCIEIFSRKALIRERLEFYKGWYVYAKQREPVFVNLEGSYITYGKSFTLNLLSKFASFSSTVHQKTLVQQKKYLDKFQSRFILFWPEIERLNQALSSETAHTAIMLIYDSLLIEAKLKGHCLKTFHNTWKAMITFYQAFFVKFGVLPEPVIEPFAPIFKHVTRSRNQIESKSSFDRLLTKIPLSYSDSKAKELIFKNIQSDIEHVKLCCDEAIETTMTHCKLARKLSLKGKIKRPEETIITPSTSFGRATGSSNPVKVGPTNLENVAATFYHYNFNFPIRNVAKFLGFKDARTLAIILAIPTQDVLYPFLAALVIEHPAITPSWLENWKLFDDRDRIHGIQKVSSNWIALSHKKRKGHGISAQTIRLNKRSKYLIDCIIELTKLGREYLQRSNSKHYRWMLLAQSSLTSKPAPIKRIHNPSVDMSSGRFREIFAKKTKDEKGDELKSKSEAIKISKSITLRRLRDSCAVAVYFKTKSVHAMSEALGHEYYQARLIYRYLPKPLWDYFAERWIRTFQNTIVYEAMKDSKLLFDIVDFSPDELDAFIENHGFKELPQILERGSIVPVPENEHITLNPNNESVFTLSVGLLQIFIGLVGLDSRTKNALPTNKTKWVKSAQFVLHHINSSRNSTNQTGSEMAISSEVYELYDLAKSNPLSSDVLARKLC